MSVSERARGRGITEVLHYTSQRGVMGAVMAEALLSRQAVELDDEIAFVFEGVWERRDPDWVDYISLSLSRINLDLLKRSRKRFPDYWWAIMSFPVSILDDDGVWFATTNNVYPPCERAQGEDGFEALFGEPIEWGYRGSKKRRWPEMPDEWPTDRAAEVLYPTRIPLERVQKLYVPGDQHHALVNAWSETYGLDDLPVAVDVAPFS